MGQAVERKGAIFYIGILLVDTTMVVITYYRAARVLPGIDPNANGSVRFLPHYDGYSLLTF